jgi:guanylate kinase
MACSGKLIIVSGPSGAGKSALAGAVLQTVPNLKFSISYTTRPPRGRETDGVEYYFVDLARFEKLIKENELLEWAEVYGNLYGTSKRHIDESLERGEDVLLDIDVQGAHNIRGTLPDAVSIFILPPSYEVLRQRLESRKLDKDYEIENRLKIARQEIQHYTDYDYLIVNEGFEESVAELQAIIMGLRCRMAARAEKAKLIIDTFGGLDAANS